MRFAFLLLLLACPLKAADQDYLLTVPEYKRGLQELRGYFVKRNEDPAVAELYIKNLENAFPAELGRPVPVTRGVFQDFLRYQAAWTRKTRDSKNPSVSKEKLAQEVERARELKEEFRVHASRKSPAFYRAFQTAVREVRALKRRDGKDYAGSSAVFFSDHIDNSYTHVDAGDEALEKGDVKTAVKEADLALAANPANADALVLRAGARYEAGDKAAAVADAQAALVLDPSNRQAQAILSLSSKPSGAGLAAFSAATAALGGDGRSDALPADVIVTDDVPASGRLAPTATPAVGRLLSADLSVRAVERAGQNPRESARELGLAVALDPSNASARGWHSTMANRTGDYGAALGSAERAIAADPKDGLAYFNKAFALAGAGDKKGMVTALEQAAQADPAYEGALRQAQGMDDDFLQHLFEDPANARQPEVPQPRHPQASPLLMILCALGAALALGGGAIFFWPNRRSGPELVGR